MCRSKPKLLLTYKLSSTSGPRVNDTSKKILFSWKHVFFFFLNFTYFQHFLSPYNCTFSNILSSFLPFYLPITLYRNVTIHPSPHLLFILTLIVPILFAIKIVIFFFIQSISYPHKKCQYSLSLSLSLSIYIYIFFFFSFSKIIILYFIYLCFKLVNFCVELYFGLR